MDTPSSLPARSTSSINLSNWLPILSTLRNYRSSWLRGDLLAGLTACVVMIPSVIAYAELVHMPPVTGLYAALGASVGYALFASSRQVIAGPDAAIGLLAGTAILPLAAGDPSRIPMLAAILAVLSGLVLMVAARLRVGTIADFLSRPVLIGYLNGAALILASTQMGKLFALKTEGEAFFLLLWQVVEKLAQTHVPTFLFGMTLILLLVLINRMLPKVPGALVVSALAILATQYLGLAGMGIALVGEVPSGTPQWVIPTFNWSDIPALAPAAVAIAFLAFSDGLLLAQSFADKNRYDIDANQELTALGMSNVAAGLLQGFPVSASSSRTVIVDATGGRTQMAQLVAALGLLLFLYFLTGLIALLPKVALGAILIVTALGMLEVGALRDLYRMDRFEFLVSMMVTGAILVAGVVPGIIFGLLISLGGLIMEISRPGDAVLRRLRPGKRFHDFGLGGGDSRQEGETVPGLLVYRLYAPLIFANARYVITRLENLVESAEPPIQWIILDAQAITDMDITAAQRFAELHRELESAGVDLKIADAADPLMRQLEKVGLSRTMGTQEFYPSVKKAVEAYEALQYPVREIRLLVQQADQEPCQLLFRREGSNMTATCSCTPEEREGLCPHRLAVLLGDTADLTLLEGDPRDLADVATLLKGTDIEKALETLVEADRMMQQASRGYHQAKEQMIKAMKD